MELNDDAKVAVRELGAAIEKSVGVGQAIENLREIGFEPQLTLRLEIGLLEIHVNSDDFAEEVELDLTDEDLRTLRRMKIRLE